MNISWWYNIVARRLNLDHVRLVCECAAHKLRIEELENEIADLLSIQTRMVQQDKLLNNTLNSLARELHEARHRPDMVCVLSSRDHAATQRIKDLEFEVTSLQEKLRKK
jgi:septal ring factor EnvC (AmiA/AmiB activator)